MAGVVRFDPETLLLPSIERMRLDRPSESLIALNDDRVELNAR